MWFLRCGCAEERDDAETLAAQVQDGDDLCQS